VWKEALCIFLLVWRAFFMIFNWYFFQGKIFEKKITHDTFYKELVYFHTRNCRAVTFLPAVTFLLRSSWIKSISDIQKFINFVSCHINFILQKFLRDWDLFLISKLNSGFIHILFYFMNEIRRWVSISGGFKFWTGFRHEFSLRLYLESTVKPLAMFSIDCPG